MPDKDTELLHDAAELLAQCRTAGLATTDARGKPHAANIQYAHDDRLNLYFVSSPDAAHSQHILTNPKIALTVYHPDDAEPQNIRGLQIHAHAEPVTDTIERHEAMRLYKARYTFIAKNPILLAAVKRQTLYRLTPTWLRLIDNRRGFGWKLEVQLD